MVETTTTIGTTTPDNAFKVPQGGKRWHEALPARPRWALELAAGTWRQLSNTENSRYKHTVGTGGGMLITNICLYREKIIYMRKLTNVTGNRY